jgi:hypothetical protein
LLIDVDAEIRDMESKFCETLKLLGDHVKNRIKGKGMAAINHIMLLDYLSTIMKKSLRD